MTENINDFVVDLEEFTPELRIDKYRLDDEIAKQGDLYYRASARCAEAISYRDRAKHELAVIEAETAQELRTRNAEAGEKTTESGVKEAVTLDKRVKQAVLRHIAWDRTAREWSAMQSALDQRSKALRDMSQLYVAGYFTVTSAGRAEGNVKEVKADLGRRALTASREQRPERIKLRD